jgi:hypothetical protein
MTVGDAVHGDANVASDPMLGPLLVRRARRGGKKPFFPCKLVAVPIHSHYSLKNDWSAWCKKGP